MITGRVKFELYNIYLFIINPEGGSNATDKMQIGKKQKKNSGAEGVS